MLDPTPCPASRYGVSTTRASLLGDADPSVTLPRIGLRDAKPRRPTRRPSLAPQGRETTVEICEDTFQLRKAPSLSTAPPAHETDPTIALHAAKSNRRSTIFAQPALRPVLPVQSATAMAPNAHKRRLSSITGNRNVVAPLRTDNGMDPASKEPTERPTIAKEARRRTIYMPSEDTTMLTIHPGRSLQTRDDRPRKARKSDVFLDILDEEAEPQAVASEVSAVPPARRTARPSLLAAPRRMPLQMSANAVQDDGHSFDRHGRGDGKENVPPAHGSESKGACKRTSFSSLEKPTIKPPRPLDVLAEETEGPKSGLDSVRPSISKPRHSMMPPCQPRDTLRERRPRESLSTQARRSSVMLRRRDSVMPRDVRLATAQSCAPATVDRQLEDSTQPKAFEPLSTLAKYPVIAEDISNPSLYEDDWLQHQEHGMTQLINSLFERANGKAASALNVAEQMTLRQDLLKLHQTTDTAYMHKRLQASLQFGALNIPSDTLAQVARFKDDLGQRTRFIDLWVKTYNTEALQTAAEIVVGRQRSHSPRNSGSSTSPTRASPKSTALFLRTFLVMNEDAPGESDSPGFGARRSGGRVGLDVATGWRRTVMRSLMLIHLLDHAQESGLLRGCLFQTTSPYKSSLAVLQGLCRLLIPSVGDVSRALHHLGYSLTHVQHPLTEYEYMISNLATDMRDGIRLTRLVETLLYSSDMSVADAVSDSPTITLATGDILPLTLPDAQSSPLSQHLKHPALSRTQKVHNTSVALAALSNSKETRNLVDDIRPEDLVDGHREKTVRLLWGLVSRWGLEYLVDFSLVRREITRLRKLSNDENEFHIELDMFDDFTDTAGRYANLLHAWAAAAARPHNVPVPNLSTAFADGRVCRAILATYAPHLSAAAAQTPPTTAHPSASAPAPTPTSLTLSHLGCSHAFQSLFPSVSAPATHHPQAAPRAALPSRKTTIPLLAFLAARLLPAATPSIAAARIQRAWRAWSGRRRRVCARLARDAATVVRTQARIEWAAVVLQRRWRGLHWL